MHIEITQTIQDKQEPLADMYRRAFLGKPWFEDLSSEEVNKRLTIQSTRRGFQALVARSLKNEIAGALWFDSPSLEVIESERGTQLAQFAKRYSELGIPIVWEREVIVDPNFQNQGIATRLRETFLSYLRLAYPNGAIILTRMRDDNDTIIAIAKRLGFERTGIATPSSQVYGVNHEYWYKNI